MAKRVSMRRLFVAYFAAGSAAAIVATIGLLLFDHSRETEITIAGVVAALVVFYRVNPYEAKRKATR